MDAWEEGVQAASHSSSFRRRVRPGNPRGRPGWEPTTPSPPSAGGAWCGWDLLLLQRLRTPPACPQFAFLDSPPSHFSSPLPVLRVHLHIEDSPPRAWGQEEAVGARMLKGCPFSRARGAALERKCACVSVRVLILGKARGRRSLSEVPLKGLQAG